MCALIILIEKLRLLLVSVDSANKIEAVIRQENGQRAFATSIDFREVCATDEDTTEPHTLQFRNSSE